MRILADQDLATVAGGLDVMNTIDGAASTVYPRWKQMSCTSRAMWVGTAAGAATGAAGSAINPALGSLSGPIAGTLASTSYLEACQARETKK
jgi:hypothetical protein